MALGFGLGAAGYALLALIVGPQTPYAWFLPGMIFIPVGIGLAIPAMTEAVLASVDRTRSGIASGVLNTARQAGGAIGVAVFGTLVARGAGALVPGVRGALIASAAILGLTALIAGVGVQARAIHRR